MATENKSTGEDASEPPSGQVQFFVEPGTKVTITVKVGDKLIHGKVPLTVHVEQAMDEQSEPAQEQIEQAIDDESPAVETPQPIHSRIPLKKAPGLGAGFEALKKLLRGYDLTMWLFISAVAVYLITRLIGLTQFPIYFFTDEAIQSLSMIDLIENGYRDRSGVWFPTYFRNGEYYNIGVSVYLQWLPAIFFGKSAIATRAVSVIITLIAAVSVGLMLRDVFRLRYWWTGVLFLSITPAWFLHSRTAFETAEFVAFYAGTLCAYLFYRYKSTRYLYLTFILGALAFYTYSPAQVIVPLTVIGLLISDWRYHWENRYIVLKGLALGVILALPYIRYNVDNPNVPFAHLHTLGSYWYEKIPLSEKITHYLSEYGIGLSPWYWYIPNNRDLARHLMKDYGHIMIGTLPFALIGLAHTLRNLRQPAYRAILTALIISPAASAFVQIAITRVLVFVVPATLLTAIGLERTLHWIQDPQKSLDELAEDSRITRVRIVGALIILFIAISIALNFKENINRTFFLALAFILALQVSGALEKLAQLIKRTDDSIRPKLWKLSQPILVLSAFFILAGSNVWMLNDALTNGPLWFRDYGLGGMQYGAFQIFDIIDQYVKDHPNAKVILSPDWANGANIVARYFLDDFSSIQIGSVRGHITAKLPLDDNTLFILTPQEYDVITGNEKLTGINVERIIPYPDGGPGFYFVHLRYVDNIDEIFAAEKAAREALQESSVTIDGEEVKLRHSYLDSEFQDKSMALVFDNDTFTVAKTYEANPFFFEMTFPEARTINGFSIIIGSANVQITLKFLSVPGAEPIIYTFEGQGTRNQPELSFDLPTQTQAQILQVEVLDLNSPGPTKVHVWELKLR